MSNEVYKITDSILTSIKKMLGITEECTAFDADLIIHINSVLMILTQIGVGPSEGFFIEDKGDFWEDFLEDDIEKLEAVKTFVYLKVRLIFDPPSSSAVAESFNRTISELEWRLHIAAESNEN